MLAAASERDKVRGAVTKMATEMGTPMADKVFIAIEQGESGRIREKNGNGTKRTNKGRYADYN